MAGYGRAPNVSQYISNLNSIAGAQDTNEGANLEDDLAWVVNTELFDFDLGSNEGHPPQNFGQRQKQTSEGEVNTGSVNFEGNYNNYFEGQPLELNTNFPFDPQLVQQSPQSATFSTQQQTQQQQQTPTSATPSEQNNAGVKRSHSVSSPASVEDAARMAAEEDKRRRNTAASARFRVKKKQREAALEKTAKEMTDKVEQLQKRVSELEMENKWLRELVVEKGAGVKAEDGESKADNTATAERIPNEQGKKGVGTKTESS